MKLLYDLLSMETIENKKIMLEGSEPVRQRSDRFIGSRDNVTDKVLVITSNGELAKCKMMYSPALFLVCCELINNATDHIIRTKTRKKTQVTYINIDIDKTTISVTNDGEGIPLIYNKRYGDYTPTIFFGRENSGENIDDNEHRYTSGRNGCGSYIVNAFSKTFTIALITTGTSFVQKFYQYAEKKKEPIITSTKSSDSIMITADIDTSYFHDTTLEDIFGILYRKIFEISCIFSWISIKCNGDIVPNSFSEYVDRFVDIDDKIIVYDEKFPGMKLALFTGSSTYHYGYVNGVEANKGTHINKLLDELLALTGVIQTKKKSIKITPTMIKKQLSFVLVIFINNPAFGEQVKGTLTTPIISNIITGKTITMVKTFIKDKIMPKINAAIGIKQLKDFMSKSKNVSAKYLNIKKYICANNITRGSGCTLIVTEGDSAQAAVKQSLNSLESGGNPFDFYGIYPLKGKSIKNPRKKNYFFTPDEHGTFIDLIKIIGLQVGDDFKTEYDMNKKLYYCRIMIITDADPDGIDIKSQIINAFSYFWPSLLTCGFFISLRTPCIRIKNGKKTIKEYYTIEQYKKEVANAPKGEVHYYKGLGTNTKDEFDDVLSNKSNRIFYTCKVDIDGNKIGYKSTENDLKLTLKKFDEAFSKDTSIRKDWVLKFNQKRDEYINSIPFDKTLLTYIEHVEKFHILFADYKNRSSIPSIIDGLKPTQRKIIDAMLYRIKKSKKGIKVTELSGKISNVEYYQHGDVSLNDCIIRMAQDFPGTNNLPLLVPIGSYSTRIDGPNGASAARYLHTRLQDYTSIIFNEDDYPLYEHVEEEDHEVEPNYFVPIIPLVLVNGAQGMGYGVSTEIPHYKARDIIKYIIDIIKDNIPTKLIPFCNGIGYYENVNKTSYTSKAKWELKGDKLYVYETPVETWYGDFDEFLKESQVGVECKCVGECKCKKLVKSYEHIPKTNRWTFIIELGPDVKDIEKDFQLTKKYSFTNMVGYDQNNMIHIYPEVEDIIENFITVRLQYYEMRKEYMIKRLKELMAITESKYKFISAVWNDEIILKNKKAIVVSQIENYKKFKFVKENDGYDYLTNMKITKITQEGHDELKKEYDKYVNELKKLIDKSINDMYLEDLNELLKVVL